MKTPATTSPEDSTSLSSSRLDLMEQTPSIDAETAKDALSWERFVYIYQGGDKSDCNKNEVVTDYRTNSSARDRGRPIVSRIDYVGRIIPCSCNRSISFSNAPVEVFDPNNRATEGDSNDASEFALNFPSNITTAKNQVHIIEEDDGQMYPRDSYSFLALNGPQGNHWPLQKFFFFAFGLIPFLFQMALLELLICYLLQTSGRNNPDSGEMSGDNVRVAQVVSLLVYIVFPNSTLKDVIKAIQFFPWRSVEDLPVGCIRVSCILKGLQANYSLVVVFLLVMSCDNTLEIILNFTAVNFISDLDNVAFSHAQSGAFGPSLRREATRIAGTKLPMCMYRERQHIWHGAIIFFTAIILFGSMVYLNLVQQTNYTWIALVLRTLCAVGSSTIPIIIIRFILCSCSCKMMPFFRNLRKRFFP